MSDNKTNHKGWVVDPSNTAHWGEYWKPNTGQLSTFNVQTGCGVTCRLQTFRAEKSLIKGLVCVDCEPRP
jgi:hypothetical protein